MKSCPSFARALDAVLAGDVATHDRIVGEGLAELSGAVNVIVLAKASMASVVANLPPERLKVPILSSPELAVSHAAEVMAGAESGAIFETGFAPAATGLGPCR